MKTKKLTLVGVMTAIAMVVSYLESLIPLPIGIPGIKLGLANVVIVVALYRVGTREALLIDILRIVLLGFTFGNLSVMIYSLAGGMLSFLCMYLGKRFGRLHIYTVSIIGGVSHNVGQLIVALFVLTTKSLAYYLPVLLIAGVITGFVIGAVAREIEVRLPKKERV